ncbi:histone-like nucleoid-structuring protein Lsr2 [Streptomyces sp. NPDC058534]|uniref:Lsr2 family DNA-binding protein n=1 Tax=Streptomyces sp. NPDC058534 TaxID=3346541 RepID=UPI0036530E6B
MTAAALRRLLDEIDTQGGPEAARHNRLHIPDPQEGPAPMATAPELHAGPALTIAVTESEPLPVGQLLKWGDEHADPEVQDQAARARVLLGGLRHRHAADRELTAISDERQQLEKRLAEIQAREAELAPPKKARRAAPSYDAPAVRAWARKAGVGCPDRGRVPKTVLDAWRASLPQATEPAA